MIDPLIEVSEETRKFFPLENDLILMTIEFLNPEEAPSPASSFGNLAILPPREENPCYCGTNWKSD